MAVPRVLVIDDDAWILRMVTAVLEKRGYEIVTASDGEEGLKRALSHPPDLVISDVMMPGMDGWTLVKQLRSHPELAFVPFIFLTALGSDEDRLRGFRLGADDYLPKPFRFEELDLRVASALRRRVQVEATVRSQARAAQSREPPALTGSLEEIGLSALLTVLELERKSGVLVLRSGGRTGRVFLSEGRAVHASFDGEPEPANRDVVFEVLGWSVGQFEFAALEIQMDDAIGLTTTQLLMEGARRLDERRKAEEDAAPD